MVHFNTVNSTLKSTLESLMDAKELESFRLVGGTALSLQLGHRISVDIDMFSDAEYGSIDFDLIERFLQNEFQYVGFFSNLPTAFGKGYLIGKNENDSIKLDLYYTDAFKFTQIEEKGIRMANLEEISAMKLDVVQRGGRKKDFWDLHELLEKFNVEEILNFHLKRYPFSHDRNLIIQNLTNFEIADEDFNPICLKGKYWEFIKEDLEELISLYKNSTS